MSFWYFSYNRTVRGFGVSKSLAISVSFTVFWLTVTVTEFSVFPANCFSLQVSESDDEDRDSSRGSSSQGDRSEPDANLGLNDDLDRAGYEGEHGR